MSKARFSVDWAHKWAHILDMQNTSAAMKRALGGIADALAPCPLGCVHPLSALSAEMTYGPATVAALVKRGLVETYRDEHGARRVRVSK